MAHLDHESRTLLGRLAYFGPAASGKTTSLEAVFHRIPRNQRGRVAASGGAGERVIAYDCRLLEPGVVPGWKTHLRVATAPGTPSKQALKRLLAGVDGIVFVVDSQPERVRESVHAREALLGLLRELEQQDAAIPIVFQWNKRDVTGAYPTRELDLVLNPRGEPAYASTATSGKGVAQAFEHAARLIVERLRRAHGPATRPLDPQRSIVIPRATGSRTPRPRGATGKGPAIGPFHVTCELGRDGVSVTYRGADEQGREVVLKVLTEGAARAEEGFERFQRTASRVTELKHPGLVEVLGAGVHAGQPYLAYAPLEDGHDLNAAFASLPLGRRVTLIRDAGRALGAAHALGLVHRNLKPETLRVDRAGQLKVVDLGLSTGLSLDLTKSGAYEDRPTHMAPEQLDGSDFRVGPPTDVWALGVALYQALTGQLPFRSPRVVDLVPEILAAQPAPPTGSVPALSPTVEAICLRALSRDPAQRYADGAALAAELDWELESLMHSDVALVDAVDEGAPSAVELPDDPQLASGVEAAARDSANRVGRTVLLSAIESAEPGELHRAWDLDDRQLVLVRVLPGVAALGDASVQLERLASLPRDAGLSLRGYGVTDDGRLYLVTDGIAGETLAHRRRSAKRVLVCLRDVARTLAATASSGLLHGGLQPGCVLIDKTFGRGHVLDFGLAHVLAAQPKGPTLPARFRAPECFARSALGDARSDVYGLGATLYFGLTRQPPGTGTVAPPSQLAPQSVPKTLDTICLKALRETPSERYADAAAFADALDRFLERFASSPSASG